MRLRSTPIDDDARRTVLSHLRRIAGQVEGIARMVGTDRYCTDLLLQIASAQAALGQVTKLILRSHVETCVSEVMSTGKSDERKHKIDALLELFARYGDLGSRSAARKPDQHD